MARVGRRITALALLGRVGARKALQACAEVGVNRDEAGEGERGNLQSDGGRRSAGAEAGVLVVRRGLSAGVVVMAGKLAALVGALMRAKLRGTERRAEQNHETYKDGRGRTHAMRISAALGLSMTRQRARLRRGGRAWAKRVISRRGRQTAGGLLSITRFATWRG